MKKPEKPKRPKKPQEIVDYQKSVGINYTEVTIDDFRDVAIEFGCDPEEIKLCVDVHSDYYESEDGSYWILPQIKNPNYEKEMKKYKKDWEKYKAKQEAYKEKLEAYKTNRKKVLEQKIKTYKKQLDEAENL